MKLDDHTIDTIGVWAMRLIGCAGMVIATVMGKPDAAVALGIALLASFLFL